MATQQNTFIRRFGKLAIIITVTDWEDFKELEQYSKHESPDFLISSTTTSSMYSNFQPTMQLNLFTAEDITEGTQGSGLANILTNGCCNRGKNKEFEKYFGGFWSYRKVGLTYAEEISKPKIDNP